MAARTDITGTPSVSTLEVRGLALLLLLAWLALGGVLLVGSQLALALATVVPAALAGLAAGRPRPSSARSWLLRATGVLGALLTVSLVALVGEPLIADHRLMLPSAEMNYAALIALAATVGYAAGNIVAQPRPLLLAAAIGLPAALGATALVVAERPPAVPPECAVPVLATSAQVTIAASAEVDGQIISEGRLAGERAATDERWTADLAGTVGAVGSIEFVQVDGGAWLRRDNGEWQATAAGPTLDSRLIDSIEGRPLPAVEDLGIELRDGRPTRRCRIAIDGTSAAAAVPLLAWLAGAQPPVARARLGVWRGELDWWLGDDGRLEYASIIIGGLPADPWRSRGMRGRLMADMSVTQPAEPPVIEEPRP